MSPPTQVGGGVRLSCSMRVATTVTFALFLGCAATSPRPTGPSVTERTGPSDQAPGPASYAERPDPGPSARPEAPPPDELLALLGQHRAASGPPELEDGRLGVPQDWKTLPQSAVVWRREDLYPHGLVAIGDTLLTRRQGIVAFDAHNGDERWHRPVGDGERSYAVEGCDGVAVLFEPRAVVGVVADTGEERWTRPLEPRADSIYTTPGFPRRLGCHVGFLLVSGARQLAEREKATLVTVDTRTGEERTLAECRSEGCQLESDPGSTGWVLTDQRGPRFVPLRGAAVALPERTEMVAGEGAEMVAVAQLRVDRPFERGSDSDGPRWRGQRTDGTVLWESSARFDRLGRLGDDLIVLRHSDHSIARMDLKTGRDRWALPLSDELHRLFARRDGRAIEGSRLAVANRTTPDLILLLDLETGRPEALRLAPQDPVELRLTNELLILGAHDETVVMRLDRETPPLRSRLPLEADVAQSIGELGEPLGRPPEATTSGHIPPHLYPAGANAARQWLAHLGPLALPTLETIVREGTLAEAAMVVPVFARQEGEAKERIVRMGLERSLATEPTLEAARLRAQTAKAYGGQPLSPRLATALANGTIGWLRHARQHRWLNVEKWRGCGRGGAAEGSPECERMTATHEALVATRNLLERSATSSVPLRRLREELAGDQSHPNAGCEADDAAAARAAVLSHLFEFWLAPPAEEVLAPGLGCAPVMTLAGPVTIRDAEKAESRPFWSIGPAHEPREAPETRGAAWADAPILEVSYEWYSGPLAAEGGSFLVGKIDGMWRVVSGGTRWVS